MQSFVARFVAMEMDKDVAVALRAWKLISLSHVLHISILQLVRKYFVYEIIFPVFHFLLCVILPSFAFTAKARYLENSTCCPHLQERSEK